MASDRLTAVTEQIRNASDIAHVIGGYVALKKSGTRLTGLCPFHREDTPSFSVDSNRQRFHCFGCGADGDVFDFVGRIEGVPFTDSRRMLGEAAGIQPDRPLSPAESSEWAAERRAIERDLPAARLWRLTAVDLADEFLDKLKDALFNPEAKIVPAVGEVAEWTRLLDRFRRLDGGDLVAEYNNWRARDRKSCAAMVQAGSVAETTARNMAWLYIDALSREATGDFSDVERDLTPEEVASIAACFDATSEDDTP